MIRNDARSIYSTIFCLSVLLVQAPNKQWQVTGSFVPFIAHKNGNMLLRAYQVPIQGKTKSLRVTSSKALDIANIANNRMDDKGKFISDYETKNEIPINTISGSTVSTDHVGGELVEYDSKEIIHLELKRILDDIVLHHTSCSSDDVDCLVQEISSLLNHINQENKITKLLSEMDTAVLELSSLSRLSALTDPSILQKDMDMAVQKVEACAEKVEKLRIDREKTATHLQSFSEIRSSIYSKWIKIKNQNEQHKLVAQDIEQNENEGMETGPTTFTITKENSEKLGKLQKEQIDVLDPAKSTKVKLETKGKRSLIQNGNDLNIKIENNKIHVNFETAENGIESPTDQLKKDENMVTETSYTNSYIEKKALSIAKADLNQITSSSESVSTKNKDDENKETVKNMIVTKKTVEEMKMVEENLSQVQINVIRTSIKKESKNNKNKMERSKIDKSTMIQDKLVKDKLVKDSKIKEEGAASAEANLQPSNLSMKSKIESENGHLIKSEKSESIQENLVEGDLAEVSNIDKEDQSSSKVDTKLNTFSIDSTDTEADNEAKMEEVEEVDVAIVGAGIGGLCAGAILNTLYGKKVGIYESHYLPGGCAHAFDRTVKIPSKDGNDDKVTFTFDSGPTIVLGCSAKPYNPLRQVLNVIGLGDEVEWIPYDKWGMIENPGKANKELRWKVELGPETFEKGPLVQFGGENVLKEFQDLREATKGLVSGAVEIPAMAMRSGKSALLPLLRYFPALVGLIQQGTELTQGTFAPFMDGPNFVVKDKWLRDWLDALAFSLSGLPACRTSAAAMAYVLYDMHRDGASLDYPKGGLGKIIDALVIGVEQGDNNSKVNLRSHVKSITTSKDGKRVTGLKLRSGKTILAKDGVICNAPVWSLNGLIDNDLAKLRLNSLKEPKLVEPRQTWNIPADYPKQRSIINNQRRSDIKSSSNNGESSLLEKCDSSEMTGSFIHLHLALDASDLDLDSMEAHYTVMDRGLSGDESLVLDGPCSELNMIAVSNPCVLDRTLAPPGYIVVHAYGAGNEPYEIWKDLCRDSPEYKKLKEERSDVLWRAVESIIPDVRKRVVSDMVGSPITHERFLRRPRGTYGSATEDYLKDGSTALKGLVLAGDGVFPGIGVPAVALSGASAANSLVDPLKQWSCLDELKKKGLL